MDERCQSLGVVVPMPELRRLEQDKTRRAIMMWRGQLHHRGTARRVGMMRGSACFTADLFKIDCLTQCASVPI
jgi:hypothetical protein